MTKKCLLALCYNRYVVYRCATLAEHPHRTHYPVSRLCCQSVARVYTGGRPTKGHVVSLTSLVAAYTNTFTVLTPDQGRNCVTKKLGVQYP